MGNTTKATTALVAVALGLATVTAAFVTVSSTASVADSPAVKIQDRLQSEVRLISIDDADETTLVQSDPVKGETIALRVVPLPAKAPRSATLPAVIPAGNAGTKSDALTLTATVPLPQPRIVAAVVPVPQPRPGGIASLDTSSVPLPLPRPSGELVVGSLTAAEHLATP